MICLLTDENDTVRVSLGHERYTC